VDRRPLGRTGLSVTPIGFGAFKIGRNQGIKYPIGYPLPDEAEVARLLRGVLHAGIGYIDTAPAYGLSEERLGALLPDAPDIVISTKVGERFEDGISSYDFSVGAVQESVRRSLVRLRRRRLDAVFIHAHADDVAVLEQTPVVETLFALKAEGLIGAIGFSGRTVQAAMKALDFIDILMVEYHLQDRSHAEVIRSAAARGIGVVVKKGLASGRLPADEAIRFVLGTEGVASLIVGGLDIGHILQNVASAGGRG